MGAREVYLTQYKSGGQWCEWRRRIEIAISAVEPRLLNSYAPDLTTPMEELIDTLRAESRFAMLMVERQTCAH